MNVYGKKMEAWLVLHVMKRVGQLDEAGRGGALGDILMTLRIQQ